MTNSRAPRGITQTTEASSTPITDDEENSLSAGTNTYFGDAFTLPTTENFYKITGVEWKNGTVASNNMMAMVYKTHADPPTQTEIELLAYTKSPVVITGTSAVQRASTLHTKLIPAGTVIIGAISSDSATPKFRDNVESSENRQKALAYRSEPLLTDATAWTANTTQFYIKVYYQGYK